MISDPAVRFETVGCKLNQIESESAARAFSDAGFVCSMDGVSSASPSDNHTVLCIVNTCTVTAKAEQKCRRIIRLLLEKYPCAAVLVTGCYAQLDSIFLTAMNPRIAVLGGRQKDALASLPAFMHSYIQGDKTCGKTCRTQCTPEAVHKSAVRLAASLRALYGTALFPAAAERTFILSTDTFLQHSRPSLKIQDGCDNRCSYCRICFARGPSVSLQANKVLERVLRLEKIGHRETVLTGVNLSQYRFFYAEKKSAAADCTGTAEHADNKAAGMQDGGLAQLLQYLLNHTETVSFRLSSLHPQSIDDELCSVLAHERIRPHFHLSVQSGSDTVLKAMRRPYNADCIQKAVQRLRRIKKLPFIACDIIAGFPGETAEDFGKTAALCRTCNFSWIHAFPFSPRPGTDACTMQNTVPPAEARRRVQELTAIAHIQKKAYIESCIGGHFKAVIEKFRKGELRAVTENFLHVRIKKTAGRTDGNISLTPETAGGKEVLVRIDSVYETGSRSKDCEAVAVLL